MITTRPGDQDIKNEQKKKGGGGGGGVDNGCFSFVYLEIVADVKIEHDGAE